MLNEKIISAKEEIAAINAELKRIPFGRDIYQFKMEEKSDRAVFFTICKNLELYSESPDLFTERTVSDEKLADDVHSFLNKILDTEQEEDYSDYRNYFTYDMTIRSHIGDEESEMDLSKNRAPQVGEKNRRLTSLSLRPALCSFILKMFVVPELHLLMKLFLHCQKNASNSKQNGNIETIGFISQIFDNFQL